jgi:hypothetical protein
MHPNNLLSLLTLPWCLLPKGPELTQGASFFILVDGHLQVAWGGGTGRIQVLTKESLGDRQLGKSQSSAWGWGCRCCPNLPGSASLTWQPGVLQVALLSLLLIKPRKDVSNTRIWI